MPSLKEIKKRIASVQNTLKITSAMKMVASAKLHKTQKAIGNLLPYQEQLLSILSALVSGGEAASSQYMRVHENVSRVAVVGFSSNTSLCGSFNNVVLREASRVVGEYRSNGVDIKFYAMGQKMAEAARKLAFGEIIDKSGLLATAAWTSATELADELTEGFVSGSFDRVELVYHHFKSASSQPVQRELYLPLQDCFEGVADAEQEYILEPDLETLVEKILPKYLRLKIFTVLLDALQAEHAARTVAMQIASDNAEDLLYKLTLEYNKSRQQKITDELLDLEGGTTN